MKRFQVLSITRDRPYDLTKGGKGRVHYLTANPNGEAEVVSVSLTQSSKARKKIFDFDFAEIEIKGRGAGGNILTKHPVRKIVLKEEGRSTLGGVDIWYEPTAGRLNRDERGNYLGNFVSEDKIVAFYKEGSYETTSFELTNHYDFNNVLGIYKLDKEVSFNAIHYDGDAKTFYVKRFIIDTNTPNKRFSIVTDARRSKLVFVSKGTEADVEVKYKEGRRHEVRKLNLMNLIDTKGWKAIGNKLPVQQVISVSMVKTEKPQIDLDVIKEEVKHEVEEEERNQLGLFGENGKS